jgi:hypothetical protein
MANFLQDTAEQQGFGIGDALADLGLPNMQSNDPIAGIQVIYVAHADYSLSARPRNDPEYKSLNDQTYNVGATTYRATGGYYKFGINTSIGGEFIHFLHQVDRTLTH